MRRHTLLSSSSIRSFTVAVSLAFAVCARADSTPPQTYGPHPQLPAPHEALIPTLNIAPAVGWNNGGRPVAASGFKVTAFARGLNHPRFVYVLPNGDVLAVETAGPGEPVKSIRGWVQKQVMSRAGSVLPSPNRIMLLRDKDGDGDAETRSVFLKGVHSPYGVVLVGGDLYVANTDSVVRYPYLEGETAITAPGTKVTDLPGGPIDHHWTKTIVASPDGKRLFVSVGSNSNIGENGMAAEQGRASIWEIDRASGHSRIYASGIRNGAGLAIHPETGELWVASNERDEIGDDVPPDYMTRVQDGGFYGWPYSYWGRNVDERVKPQRPDLVAKAITPDYALGAHTASLGLTFYNATAFPARYQGGAFVGQHGSWNRSPPSGYKVIFVPFTNGRPSGMPEDILTGFLDKDGNALGRPVGVAIDKHGALLVADDVGNAVWRVTSGTSTAMNR
jgi:glucose/arabinose dehydrogenase